MSDALLPAWTEQPTSRPAVPLAARFSRIAVSVPLSFFRAGIAVALLAALVVVVLALAAMRLAPPTVPQLPVKPEVASAPIWIEIVKPVRIYSLEARDLAKLPLTYAARRLDVGDAREDRLVYGTWHPDQPSLRLSLLRNGADPAVSLDRAIVREAAEAGLSVGRSKLPETLPTRFGTFEIADVATSKGSGTAMQCSGFRLHLARPLLAIDGFACGADGHPIAHRTLGCLIDRLDLASAGEDKALSDFFAATDLKRSPLCDGMRLGPDAQHAAWLDDKEAAPAPPARRRVHRRH